MNLIDARYIDSMQMLSSPHLIICSLVLCAPLSTFKVRGCFSVHRQQLRKADAARERHAGQLGPEE